MLHQARSGFAVREAVISSPNNWRSGFGEATLPVRACSGCEVASEQPFRLHSGFEVARVAPVRGFEMASEQPFRAPSGFEVAPEQPFRGHGGFEVAQLAPVREIAVFLRRQVATKPRTPQALSEIIE